MAESMHIPVIGLVENYSYVVCPDCGKEFRIFGESGIDELAEELDLPVLGKMPIDTKMAELAGGDFHLAQNEYLAAAEALLINLR
jgi:Mrp family chromosome partitioning ATPase